MTAWTPILMSRQFYQVRQPSNHEHCNFCPKTRETWFFFESNPYLPYIHSFSRVNRERNDRNSLIDRSQRNVAALMPAKYLETASRSLRPFPCHFVGLRRPHPAESSTQNIGFSSFAPTLRAAVLNLRVATPPGVTSKNSGVASKVRGSHWGRQQRTRMSD